MKRCTLLLVLSTLVISLAAPAGAVFALGEAVETATPEAESEAESAMETEQPPTKAPADSATLQNQVSQIVEPQQMSITEQSEPSVEERAISDESPALSFMPATLPIQIPEPPEEVPLPPQRKVFITAFQTTNALGFVELYNSDTKTQSIYSWRMVANFTEGEPCNVALSGYILPKTKVLLAREDMPNVSNAFTFTCGDQSRILASLTLYDGDQVIERVIPPLTDDQIWTRKNTTSTYLTGTFSQDFTAYDSKKPYTITDGYWYIPPPAPTIQILEVYVNPRSCVPPDDSADCYDFIKIKNTSEDTPLDLSNYRLRSGYSNSTSSASNTTYSMLVLAPGEVRTLTHDQYGARISFTANDGTVWFEDIEGMIAYPTNVLPYIDSGKTAHAGQSWAYNDETAAWQWATPAPNKTDNDFSVVVAGKGNITSTSEPKPCRDDQYRSEETGRCRNIAAASTLTPCKEGQYRSEETNRCRSLALAVASVLKPCADDQFRNPETNRCKAIASADDVALADCGEGRERNPETNRCRNILLSTPPEAAFAVEPTKDSATAFTGWWVLGAIAAAGAGYGIWEWRYELAAGARRAMRFTTRTK